jgi:hypothetical protein
VELARQQARKKWQSEQRLINNDSTRFRHSRVHAYEGSKDSQSDYRLTINYDLPLM